MPDDAVMQSWPSSMHTATIDSKNILVIKTSSLTPFTGENSKYLWYWLGFWWKMNAKLRRFSMEWFKRMTKDVWQTHGGPTPKKCILHTHVIQNTLFSMVIMIGMTKKDCSKQCMKSSFFLWNICFIEGNFEQSRNLISCTFPEESVNGTNINEEIDIKPSPRRWCGMRPLKEVQRTCRFNQLILDPIPWLVLGQNFLNIAISCILQESKSCDQRK